MTAEEAAAQISSTYTHLLVNINKDITFTLNLPKTVFEDLFKLLADPTDENAKVKLVDGISDYLGTIMYLKKHFSDLMDSKRAMKICIQAAQIYGLMGKISFKDPLDSKVFFSIYKKHYPNETDFMLGAVSLRMCDFFANKMIALIRSKNLDNTLLIDDFERENWAVCLSVFISELLIHDVIRVNEQSFVEKEPQQLMREDSEGINTLNLLGNDAPSEMDEIFDILNTILYCFEDPLAREYYKKTFMPMPMSVLCALSFKVGLVIGRQSNEEDFTPEFYARIYNSSFNRALEISMETFSDLEVCVYRLLNLINYPEMPLPKSEPPVENATAAPVIYTREVPKQNLVEIKPRPRKACCILL